MTATHGTYWRNLAPEAPSETAPDVSVDDGSDLEELDSDTLTETVVEVQRTEDLTREEAEEIWIPEAQRILERVAKTYHGLIEYGVLATELVTTTGVFTRAQPRSWVSRVLSAVAVGNHERSEPSLTALVVHKAEGTVGKGYDEVMRLAGDEPIEDPALREKHAAAARMECYRWAGAKIPEDGGRPAVSARFDHLQTLARKQAKADREPNICPTCFMAIPPTGVCDNCG